MPSGVMNICSALFCGFMSRFFGRRFLWTLIATSLGVMGAALMSWVPKSHVSGRLAGMYLANLIIGATPLDYQWITNNTAGHTKRALVTAMMNAAFALGNIVGPQTFQAKDAPGFAPARISLVCTWAASGVLAIVLVSYYVWENGRRDRADPNAIVEGDDISEARAFAGLTDKQNKQFRYTY
jgi:predicted MFS family arabinose efflux permease